MQLYKCINSFRVWFFFETFTEDQIIDEHTYKNLSMKNRANFIPYDEAPKIKVVPLHEQAKRNS